MSYRFLNPAPVFFDATGTAIAANGSLQFFNIGTAVPKNTFNSPALTTPNANPVPLDAAGRSNVNIWLDGDYTVVLRDALSATVWTRDVTDSDAAGTTLPALISGRFLTNNGTAAQWAVIRQVPDPTGNANRILGTDGSNLLWEAKPTAPVIPIDVTSNGVSIGDGSQTLRMIAGSDTAPSSGTNRTSKAITFGVTFLSPPIFVNVAVNQVPISDVALVATAVTNVTTTGALATFDVADRHFVSGTYINASFPFSWVAIGQVANP